MPLPKQFLEGLATTPEDWALRAVFADWCEENDRPAVAACLLWMARRHKRPYQGTAGRATWFNADTISTGLGDPQSDIPGAVFGRLEGGKTVANHTMYPSLGAAEEAFYHAWEKAREGGWNPDS